MSNRFSPSVIRSLVNKSKVLAVSFAPQGAGTPKLVSGNGIKSIVRNSAGSYTLKLQNAYRALIQAQVSIQLAAAPATVQASATLGVTNTVTLTAGAFFPGSLGNNLNFQINTGAGALSAVLTTDGSGKPLVLVTLASGGSLPSAIATAINAAINAGVGVATSAGVANITTAVGETSLASGASTALDPTIVAANVLTSGTGPLSVTVVLTNSVTGAPTDLAAATGTLVNLELFMKDAVN